MTEELTEARLDALEAAVRQLSIPSGAEHLPYRLDDLERRLNGLDSRTAEIQQTLSQQGAALSRTLRDQVSASAGSVRTGVVTAVAETLREERVRTTQTVEGAVAGVQRDAELARATSQAHREASEGILIGAATAFELETVPEVTAAAERKVATIFKGQDAAFDLAIARAERAAESPGRTVGELLVHAIKHHAEDPPQPDHVAWDYANRLKQALVPMERTREKGDQLATLADYLRGRGALAKELDGTLSGAARVLKLASSAGYSTSALADRIERHVLGGLSNLKDFRDRMEPRWGQGLKVAALNGSEKLYRALGRPQEARAAAAERKTAQSTYRLSFPRSRP